MKRVIFLIVTIFLTTFLLAIPQNYGVQKSEKFYLNDENAYFNIAMGEYNGRTVCLTNYKNQMFIYYHSPDQPQGTFYHHIFDNELTPPAHFSPAVDFDGDGQDEFLYYQKIDDTKGKFILLDYKGDVINESTNYCFATSVSHWEYFTYEGETYILPHIMSYNASRPQLIVFNKNLEKVWEINGESVGGTVEYPYPTNCIDDVDGDGRPDLILVIQNNNGYYLVKYNAVTGEKLASQYENNPLTNSFSVDKENNYLNLKNDGKKYIVFICDGKLYCLDPVDLSERFVLNYSNPSGYLLDTIWDVSLADLTGNGQNEIILKVFKLENDDVVRKIDIYNADGEFITSFDIDSFAIDDLDSSDGKNDLFVIKGNSISRYLYSSNSNSFYAVWSRNNFDYYTFTDLHYVGSYQLNEGAKEVFLLGELDGGNYLFIVLDGDTGDTIDYEEVSSDGVGYIDDYADTIFVRDENNDGKYELIVFSLAKFGGVETRFGRYQADTKSINITGTVNLPSAVNYDSAEIIYEPALQKTVLYAACGSEIYKYDEYGTLLNKQSVSGNISTFRFISNGLAQDGYPNMFLYTKNKYLIFLNQNLEKIAEFYLDNTMNYLSYAFLDPWFYPDAQKRLPDFNGDGIMDFLFIFRPYSDGNKYYHFGVLYANSQNLKDISAPSGRLYFGAYYVPVDSAIIGADFHDDSSVAQIYLKEYCSKTGVNIWGNTYGYREEGKSYGWLYYHPTYSIELSDVEGAHWFHAWGKDVYGNVSSKSCYAVLNLCHPNYHINAGEIIIYEFYLNVGDKVRIKVTPSEGDVDLYGWKPGKGIGTSNDFYSVNDGTAEDYVDLEVNDESEAGCYYFEVHAYTDATYTCTIKKIENLTWNLKSVSLLDKPTSVSKLLGGVETLDSTTLPPIKTAASTWMLFK